MRKYQLTINDKAVTVTLKELSAEAAEVEIDGCSYQVRIEQIHQQEAFGPQRRSLTGAMPPAATQPATGPTSATAPAVTATSQEDLCAPIPGTILCLHVAVGDPVEAGQPLYKLEAMKMENEISSPRCGTVTQILVRAGDSVAQGQAILQLAARTPQRRQNDASEGI
ncbi:biotin/lipoyl-containing protein [Desulfuromonas thiophila]|uniref:Biotin carboxyl carrier protein n=1 Tax=Desulfuromonas thiophila TaxID=57664 RepID=A0A1G6Z765_9BACT|nr:biotin/lipoyl-containing protein [Desulfuromonas thiophila]SDD98450.1 Biotin carboxyl carrier protein [Desulfuromonas thiophila]